LLASSQPGAALGLVSAIERERQRAPRAERRREIMKFSTVFGLGVGRAADIHQTNDVTA
jgi:hypothetical protein